MRCATNKTLHISVKILLTLLCVSLFFSVGYFVGSAQKTRALVPSGEGRVLGSGDVPAHLRDDVDFNMFWDVWNFIKESYYAQPVSDKELYYGSLKGLISGLDDPYSVYLDPEESEMFLANLEGSFEGIGAEIGIKDDKLQIIAPLANSPAELAGLQTGDWIVTIDDKETLGMTIESAVTLIRGEKGSVVTLGVSRNGLESLMPIEIVRDKIVVDSVKWKIDDDRIMVISISTFNDEAPRLFAQAVQEALANQVEGIILDLRSNPGGLLTAAIDIASSWVGYQPVVIERAQESAKTFKGHKASLLDGMKTVVLVNGGSASASEIVSGALQDYDFATVVGTTTYGKGSVQDYRTLKDGSSVKITTAEWYTPKGRTINKSGIAPDIEILFSIEQYQNGIDPQKDAARKVIFGTFELEDEAQSISQASGTD